MAAEWNSQPLSGDYPRDSDRINDRFSYLQREVDNLQHQADQIQQQTDKLPVLGKDLENLRTSVNLVAAGMREVAVERAAERRELEQERATRAKQENEDRKWVFTTAVTIFGMILAALVSLAVAGVIF